MFLTIIFGLPLWPRTFEDLQFVASFELLLPQSGDHGVKGSSVDKQILSSKLRLVYERRPCQDIMDTVCAEPDPPTADFPNGWGGFADLMHVDFKIPAEHKINGESFDGEMQIYHLHPGQRYAQQDFKDSNESFFLFAASKSLIGIFSHYFTVIEFLLVLFADDCRQFQR